MALNLGLCLIKKLAFIMSFEDMFFRGVTILFLLNIVFVYFESGRMLRVVIFDWKLNL
jgi:hypothetical protein